MISHVWHRGRYRVGFAEAIRVVLGKYATFTGRARRSEFWYWALAAFLVEIVLYVVALGSEKPGFVMLAILLYLALIVPTIAVGVRRLHDTDKSGWWLLIDLVPVVGPLILFVWFCTDSVTGPNRFGPSPKYGVPASTQ
jgi:uncharacterized membrane protein YhaH (DUF805 family)